MKKSTLLFTTLVLSITNLYSQSWTVQNTGFQSSGNGVEKISIVDANIAWCVSGFTSSVHEFAKTTDGGLTWTPGVVTPALASQFFTGIAAVDANIAYVSMYGTTGTGGAIYKTTDGGATWIQSGAGTVFTQPTSFPDDIYFWDAAHGFSYGDPINNTFEIFTTSDSGNTWMQVPAGNIPSNGAGTFYNFSPTVVIDSTVWFINTDGHVFKSVDWANNWTLTPVIPGTSLYSVSFLDDKLNGIAIASNTLSYRTADGGATWTPYTPTGPGPLPNIKAVPGSNLFVSTDYTAIVKSSYSTDMGYTWIPIDSVNEYYGLAFKDINTGYAGGMPLATTEGIYKWDAGTVGINQFYANDKVSVYPNPVRSELTVSSPEQIDEIIIADMLGKQLSGLKVQSSEVRVDVNNMEHGIYFIQTKTKNRITTQKFVKF